MRREELQIAPWARAERRQLAFKEMREGAASHVRVVFVLLFFSAILVFVYNHQVEISTATSIGLNRVMAKPTALSTKMKEGALNHEKEIDSINQQSASQP